jgi:DNA mismatch repair protein MutS2
MAFTPGDEVHVGTFGRGVVREVRNGGRCLVEVKGRAMIVEGSALTSVAETKRRKTSPGARPSAPIPERLARTHAPASLDLHGMTVDEALGALDAFLNDAILAGHAEVQVIHGRSGGRLRAAVHRRLKQVSSVRAFRIDRANPGLTIIAL